MSEHAASPCIIAHAGCLGLPGTTLEYIGAGLAAGAQGIEIDLAGTRDGVGVLSHDLVIEDQLGQKLDLARTGFSEAKTKRPDLTTLDEVLQLVAQKQIQVNIDIKDLAVIPVAAERIRAWQCCSLAYLTGIGLQDAGRVIRDYPDIRVYINLRSNGHALYLLPWLSKPARREIRLAKSYGAAGVNVEWVLCSKAWIDFAHRLDLPVSCWTIDRPRLMRRFADWGIDLLTTNDPRRAATLLNQ